MVFLGPPGTGKTHLATGISISIRACQAGHRVQFATARRPLVPRRPLAGQRGL